MLAVNISVKHRLIIPVTKETNSWRIDWPTYHIKPLLLINQTENTALPGDSPKCFNTTRWTNPWNWRWISQITMFLKKLPFPTPPFLVIYLKFPGYKNHGVFPTKKTQQRSFLLVAIHQLTIFHPYNSVFWCILFLNFFFPPMLSFNIYLRQFQQTRGFNVPKKVPNKTNTPFPGVWTPGAWTRAIFVIFAAPFPKNWFRFSSL